jgi:ribosomal protein S18 acetylase RimI-like enzyme
MLKEVKTHQQIETVVRLAKEIWLEHYSPIIGKEQTLYMLEKFQSAEAVHRQIHSENYLYYLIEPENEPAGYLAVYPRKEDLFLSKIYIKAAMQHRGLGRAAFRFAETLATELGKKTITLTVNKHNSDSIAAYSRWGFCIVDAVVTDIGDGYVMDDYILSKPCACIA